MNHIEYYVLRPRQNSETAFYVPTGNPDLVAQMRRIYSAKEMYELIRTIPSAELLSFDEEDDQKEACKDILKSGDREKIIQLMKTLYTREQKLKEKGKKLRQFEEHALKEAESLLYEELSYVFSPKKGAGSPLYYRTDPTERKSRIKSEKPKGIPFRFFLYRCTLPEPSPPARAFTSSTVISAESPSMVCLSVPAATAKSTVSFAESPKRLP